MMARDSYAGGPRFLGERAPNSCLRKARFRGTSTPPVVVFGEGAVPDALNKRPKF